MRMREVWGGAYKMGSGEEAASLSSSESEAGELLEEAEEVEHTSESTLTANKHREGHRSTREWLKTIRNGWVVRETVAITKLTVPMVSL